MRRSISTTGAESRAKQQEAVSREASVSQARKGESESSDPHYIWESERGQGAGLLTHAHQPPGGQPLPKQRDVRDLFSYLSQKVLSGGILAISKSAGLPPAAARDLESFRQYGTKSTLVFPLSTGGGKVFGLMLVLCLAVYSKGFIGAVGTYAIGTQILFFSLAPVGSYALSFGLTHGQKSVLALGMATRNIGAALAPLFAIAGVDQRAIIMVALGVPMQTIASVLAARW